MKAVREAVLFVAWLLVGWLWLMVASLLVAGVVAFTIEYFLVSASSPPFASYLLSGLSLFVAALLALFTTVRAKRLNRGVLTAVFLLGALDVATSLLTRFGQPVPRVGYSFMLAGMSVSIGAQLVNGVALVAAGVLFVFIGRLNAEEQSPVEEQDASRGSSPAEEPESAGDAQPTDGPADEPQPQESPDEEREPQKLDL